MSDLNQWRVHAYQRPDVSLNRLAVHAFYVKPKETLPEPLQHESATNTNTTNSEDTEKWKEPMTQILNECQTFHHRVFEKPKSEFRWFLHGPLTLPKTVEQYDACGNEHTEKDDRAFWPVMVEDVKNAIMNPNQHMPQECQLAAVSENAAVDMETWVPTHVNIMIFAEYGTEVVNDWILPASSANLRGTQSQSLPFSKILSKYYIGRNNISCGISADLTDIKRTGGSAACFMGTLPFQELHNFWDGYEKTRTLIPQEDSSLLQQPVGFGVGLVTEEAWKHPEVPGSATVAYHEGCGHAINMPHPTRRHPKGVMSVAQYHGTHLSQHHIAWEILKHMWSKRISSSLSGVSKADMLLNDPCNPLNALNLDDCEDCQEDRMESERLRKEEEYKILLYQFTKTIVLVNEELEEPTVLSVPTQVANNSETCWVYSSFDSTDGAGYLCRNLDSVLIVKKDEGLLRLMVAPRVTWMEAQFGCSTDIKEPTLPEESEESFNVVEQAIATKIKERLHRSVPVYGNSLYQFEEIRSAWLSQYVSTLQGTNARDTDSYMPVLLQDKARGLQLRLPPYSPQNSLSISSSASLNVDVAYRHSQFAHIRPYHDEDNSAEEFNGDNAYSTRFEEIWTDHLLSSLGITVSSLVASISEATSKVKAADMDVTLQAIRDTTTRVTIGVAKKTKSLTCFLNSMKIERSHEWGLSVEQEELMPTQEHDFQQFRRGVWMEHE